MRENDLPIAISTGQYKEFYLGVTNPAKANYPQFSHSFQTLTGLSLERAPTEGPIPQYGVQFLQQCGQRVSFPKSGPIKACITVRTPQIHACRLQLIEHLARLLVIDLAGQQPLHHLPQRPLHGRRVVEWC